MMEHKLLAEPLKKYERHNAAVKEVPARPARYLIYLLCLENIHCKHRQIAPQSQRANF